MKTIKFTLLALCIASTSNALIADKFTCTFEIKDFKTNNSSKQEKEFFIGRFPAVGSSDPQISFTTGQIFERTTLSMPTATLGANLNFYFQHAIKHNSNGSKEARQVTCVALTTDYCEHVPGSGISMCGSGTTQCMTSPEPFDQNSGWSPTPILGVGPVFNEQTLAPISRIIKNDQGTVVGMANLNCKHSGTYN